MSNNSLEAKIVVLGSQGVGKTSLVHRYVNSTFLRSVHSTIGASFLTKRVVDVDSASVVRLQIWDTAGQERFRSISKLYYRGMAGSSMGDLVVLTFMQAQMQRCYATTSHRPNHSRRWGNGLLR
jgi:small GTP-binding protein